MRSIKQVTERLPMKLDLCAELMPGQLLVEIVGTGRILIENHCGVIMYTPEEICIRYDKGILRVLGEAMKLARMSKEQLVITGSILQVCLQRGGNL